MSGMAAGIVRVEENWSLEGDLSPSTQQALRKSRSVTAKCTAISRQDAFAMPWKFKQEQQSNREWSFLPFHSGMCDTVRDAAFVSLNTEQPAAVR